MADNFEALYNHYVTTEIQCSIIYELQVTSRRVGWMGGVKASTSSPHCLHFYFEVMINL